ncbi:MAG: hypothetical protein J0H71_18245 [Rhizobiales bacterium]|nr:hypothetical protein [Hyphomicrobiales bacterium]
MTKTQAAETIPAQTDASAPKGYTRTGPGPIASIRMRWTARAVGSITFVVDEVMGDNGTPVTSRPMSRDAAIKLIDERAQAAHERYALLRSELAWPTEATEEPAVAMPPGPPPVD